MVYHVPGMAGLSLGGAGAGPREESGSGRTRTLSEGEKQSSKLNTEGLPSGWTMQVGCDWWRPGHVTT